MVLSALYKKKYHLEFFRKVLAKNLGKKVPLTKDVGNDMILVYVLSGIKIAVIGHIIVCEVVINKVAEKRARDQAQDLFISNLNVFITAEVKAVESLLAFTKAITELQIVVNHLEENND